MISTAQSSLRVFEMKVGMLWFDNDVNASLEKKVSKAVEYYSRKYGEKPTTCYLHPAMLPPTQGPGPDGVIRFGDIEIRSAQWVLLNHFWIGSNGRNN